MAQLHVALQEGFAGDAVTVVVDGDKVFARDDVTTRPEIGLATSFDATVRDGDVRVELRCGERRDAVTVRAADPVWVGFSVDEGGALVHRVSATPFGYL